MEDRQNNLEKVKKFLDLDMHIKKMIESLNPNEKCFSEEGCVDYSNNLMKELKYFKDSFRILGESLSMSEENISIMTSKMDEITNKFIETRLDYDNLKKFYINNILKMNEEPLKAIEEGYVGYALFKSGQDALKKCKTINDMLHVCHHMLFNNEKIYGLMPVIEEKEITGGVAKLLGEENKDAKDIYDHIQDVYSYEIDILSINGSIIIMARDLGHALTVNVDKENDNYRISYFIPKICNPKKANAFPGVTKVPLDASPSAATTGEYVIKDGNLGERVSIFLKNVPTDGDIVRVGHTF